MRMHMQMSGTMVFKKHCIRYMWDIPYQQACVHLRFSLHRKLRPNDGELLLEYIKYKHFRYLFYLPRRYVLGDGREVCLTPALPDFPERIRFIRTHFRW